MPAGRAEGLGAPGIVSCFVVPGRIVGCAGVNCTAEATYFFRQTTGRRHAFENGF